LRKETVENPIGSEAKRCAEIVKSGGVLLYPAETLWGIGCDAGNKEAINRIYKIKKRSESKSLITLVSSWRMLQNVVSEIPVMAEEILELSDEAITIIYPKANVNYRHLTSEDGKIAVRLVETGFVSDLINRIRRPLISTSANIGGEINGGSFEDIPKEITKAVDVIPNPELHYKMSQKPSKMISVELDGRIKVLR